MKVFKWIVKTRRMTVTTWASSAQVAIELATEAFKFPASAVKAVRYAPLSLSDLKDFIPDSESHFFSRGNMKFAGDTMRNYGVRARTVTIETHSGDKVECWELYRKRAVKHGLRSSAFFDAKTGEQRFPK